MSSLKVNAFVNQKIARRDFYSCPQVKLSSRFFFVTPGKMEITHPHQRDCPYFNFWTFARGQTDSIDVNHHVPLF